MIDIKIDNDTYQLPSSANDMTQEQLLYLANLVSKTKSIEEIKIHLLLQALNGQIYTKTATDNRNVLVVGKRKYGLTASQFTQLSSVFDYLFTKPDQQNQCEIKPKLLAQKFPYIQAGCKILFGCADGMTDLTYEQFIYLMEYAAKRDFNSMIAILFTPTKGKFDAKLIAAEAKNIEKLSPNVKLIISWFFESTMEFLAQKFKKCFTQKESATKENSFDIQNKIIDNLAKGDVTKKQTIRESMLYDVLYTLENS